MAGQPTGKAKSPQAEFLQSEAPPAAAPEGAPPLGDQLKAMFDAVATSPMPERLTQLVDELEEKYRSGELRRDPTN